MFGLNNNNNNSDNEAEDTTQTFKTSFSGAKNANTKQTKSVLYCDDTANSSKTNLRPNLSNISPSIPSYKPPSKEDLRAKLAKNKTAKASNKEVFEELNAETFVRGCLVVESDVVLGDDIAEFEETGNQLRDNTQAVIYACYVWLGSKKFVQANKQALHTGSPIWSTQKITINNIERCWSADNVKDIPRNDEGKFFRVVLAAMPLVKAYIIDLVSAYQVKKLVEKNIASYFAQYGDVSYQTSRMKKLISYAASLIPDIMSDDDLRSLVSPSVWSRYHTTAVSTPALCQRALDLFDNRIPGLIHDDVVAIVKYAADDFWDRAMSDLIPRKMVAFAYFMLEAYSQLPDNWWQGSKSVNEIPAKASKDLRAIARKLKALDEAESKITDSETMGELILSVDKTSCIQSYDEDASETSILVGEARQSSDRMAIQIDTARIKAQKALDQERLKFEKYRADRIAETKNLQKVMDDYTKDVLGVTLAETYAGEFGDDSDEFGGTNAQSSNYGRNPRATQSWSRWAFGKFTGNQ